MCLSSFFCLGLEELLQGTSTVLLIKQTTVVKLAMKILHCIPDWGVDVSCKSTPPN